MVNKFFKNIFIFLIAFIVISTVADFYYYDRVVQKNTPDEGQISYSDFRVFWFASYNIHHHILKVTDYSRGNHYFRHFWFLNPELRKKAFPADLSGGCKYTVYRKDQKFYHFRYSPFAAFFMMPFVRIGYPAKALIIWYIILNIALLAALLLIIKQLDADFGLRREHRYLILWGTFIATLRFYLMNISLGQTDILIAFFFVLFLMAYVRDRDIICGILLAFILQFKLFFSPILIYFLFTGRFKIIVSTITGFICLLFIPSYMLGFEKTLMLIRDWIEILGISVPSQILNSKNQSIVYAVGNLVLKADGVKKLFAAPKYLFYFISALLTLPVYIIMACLKKSGEKEGNKKFKYLEVSMLLLVSLLFSPIAWKAYFINLVIPLSVAIYFAVNGVKRKALYAAFGVFLILTCVVGTDLTKFIPGLNNLQLMNIAIGVLCLAFAIVYSYKQNISPVR